MHTEPKHAFAAYALPIALALACLSAHAQQQPPITEFPPDAKATTPDDLRQRLAGRTFRYTIGTTAVRLQFQEGYAFVNFGTNSDTGPWRTEGSTLCVEWRRIANNCSQMRLVGDAIYLQRPSTGEVLKLDPS